MKKRAIFGVGALLAAITLPVSSVFATGSLDYAHSMGQVDMGDTVNYVIEATSDGGYVAGGQTVQCFKINPGSEQGVFPASWLFEVGENAPIEECLEYAVPVIQEERGMSEVDLYDYCGDQSQDVIPNDVLIKNSDDAYYNFSCVDYIAKFKKDGTKEWLTVIKDYAMPVAVGETNSDYRLLTKYGNLYTFAKANGVEGASSEVELDYIEDAIINMDGTIAVADGSGICLLRADGSVAKFLSEDADEDNWGYYTKMAIISKSLVRAGDGFIVMRWFEEYDEETESWFEYEGIVKISNDLNTITPILQFDWGDVTGETGLIEFDILSADEDGNVLVGAHYYDETDSHKVMIISINRDGEVIAASDVDDLLSIASDDYSEWDQELRFLDNYMVSNPASNKLIRLAPDLAKTDTYSLADGEILYDATLLTDNSYAAVGRAQTSTDNYEVDGKVNGTYLRIITANTSDGGEANPNTSDNIKLVLAGASITTLSVVAFLLRGSKRR